MRYFIEGCDNRHRGYRLDTRRGHQQADDRMPLGNRPDTFVERGNAAEDVAPGLHQGLEDRPEGLERLSARLR